MYTKQLFRPSASQAAERRLVTTSRKQVVLGEGDSAMRRKMAAMLQADGHQVTEVADEAGLLQRVETLRSTMWGGRLFDADLILFDVHVLGRMGLDMLTEMRKYDLQTPVILIMAGGDEQMHSRAWQLRPVTVLNRPADIEDLQDLVRRLLRSSQEDVCDVFL